MRTVLLRRQNQQARRRGATAVEFAMVLPVILLMFLAAAEMTNLHFIKHTAANAAYEGARAAMVAGGSPDRGVAHAEQFLNRLGVGTGSEVTLTTTPEVVTISVRVPLNLHSLGLGRFTQNLYVTESASLRRERRQFDPGT